MTDNIDIPQTVLKTTSAVPSRVTSHESVDDEESLVSAETTSKKRKHGVTTDIDVREERKAANRRSAYQSRLRKKLLIEELQGNLCDLTEQLEALRDENKSLSHRLARALEENRQLRCVHEQQGLASRGNGVGFGMNVNGIFSNPRSQGTECGALYALLAGKVPGIGFDPSAYSF